MIGSNVPVVEFWESLQQAARIWWPVLATVVVSIVVISAVKRVLARRDEHSLHRNHAVHQLLLAALAITALIMVILELPIGETARGQLLSLLGLVLTAAIALSSTTFIGNAMAGMMLRVVGNFNLGDFVQVDSYFGRVTDMGLLHTEIQTEDRDLTTLPNLFLVTNPVKVVRSSGTIVSATVSLGYDVPWAQVEELLLKAAAKAKLKEAFMQILELGDYSVNYRVAGFLDSPRFLISARSKLRIQMLDALHGGGVEIVSPQFINQRRFEEKNSFIPTMRPVLSKTLESLPEEMMFDKANRAEHLRQLNEAMAILESKIATTESGIDGALAVEREDLEAKKRELERRRDILKENLEELKNADE